MKGELRERPNTVWCPKLRTLKDESKEKEWIRETGWVNVEKTCKSCSHVESITESGDVYCLYDKDMNSILKSFYN